MSEGKDGYGRGRRWNYEEDDAEWFEELLEDDEITAGEAAFMEGYVASDEI